MAVMGVTGLGRKGPQAESIRVASQSRLIRLAPSSYAITSARRIAVPPNQVSVTAHMSRTPKPRPVDDLLRTALWEAHGRKCAYEQETIEKLRDMEVDHILPSAVWDGDQRLPAILQALGLPSDYHPDSLDNLLPTTVRRNRQKGSWVFSETSVLFYREIAARHQAKVERLCLQYEDARNQERIRTQAQAACAANPAMRAKLMEALEATPPFPVEDVVTDQRVKFSRPRAMICCELPNAIREGSILIRINTLYLHSVHFTFEGAGIFTTLLRGLETDPSLRQRGFILSSAEKQGDDWIVTLNGTTIFLTTEELSQLCELIDLAAPHFLTALLKREQADGTLYFEPDGLRNVRLLTVKRRLWKSILEFAHGHDYADGTSGWHIFDAGGNGHIKMVRRPGDNQVIPFEAYVYPAAPSSGGPMIQPLDDVSLCWEESQSQLYTGEDHLTRVRGWTASQTFRWIADRLIPEVVGQVKDKSLLEELQQRCGTETQPRYYRETWGVDAALFTSLESWERLLKFADAAQVHYNEHPHDPVPRAVVESAFAGLPRLAELLPEHPESLGYIAEKLRVPKSGNRPALLAAGHRRLFALDSFDGSDVDNVLRVACALLDARKLKPQFPAVSVAPIVEAWKKLTEAVRFEAIRYRALGKIEQPGSR